MKLLRNIKQGIESLEINLSTLGLEEFETLSLNKISSILVDITQKLQPLLRPINEKKGLSKKLTESEIKAFKLLDFLSGILNNFFHYEARARFIPPQRIALLMMATEAKRISKKAEIEFEKRKSMANKICEEAESRGYEFDYSKDLFTRKTNT